MRFRGNRQVAGVIRGMGREEDFRCLGLDFRRERQAGKRGQGCRKGSGEESREAPAIPTGSAGRSLLACGYMA